MRVEHVDTNRIHTSLLHQLQKLHIWVDSFCVKEYTGSEWHDHFCLDQLPLMSLYLIKWIII
jgi:hypothetical protein